jgi:hypothetical protein
MINFRNCLENRAFMKSSELIDLKSVKFSDDSQSSLAQKINAGIARYRRGVEPHPKILHSLIEISAVSLQRQATIRPPGKRHMIAPAVLSVPTGKSRPQ